MTKSKFSDEWRDVCRLVKKGLKKVGHDIPLASAAQETEIQKPREIRETKDNSENEKYIRTGEMIAWRIRSDEQKERTGMVIAVIHKGESAMKCVPQGIKRNCAKFQDVSGIERVLIAVSDHTKDVRIQYLCPPLGSVKTSVRRCEDVNQGKIYEE